MTPEFYVTNYEAASERLRSLERGESREIGALEGFLPARAADK